VSKIGKDIIGSKCRVYIRDKHYGLDPNAEGHEVAEEVERKWFLRNYTQKEWEEYGKLAERIHRAEMEYKFPSSFETG